MRFVASLVLIVALLCLWLWPRSWRVRPAFARLLQLPSQQLKTQPPLRLEDFRSGDVLFFQEHGATWAFPGHVALVVRAPRYGQLFVWDMPNPLRYGPDLLKPFCRYVHNCLSKRHAVVFVQRLQGGPEVDPLPVLREVSASAHYDNYKAFLFANRVLLREAMGLPGFPDQLLPVPNSDQVFHCTGAVFHVLVRLGVLDESVLRFDDVLCPSRLLAEDFDLDRFARRPFGFGPPQRLLEAKA